MNKLLRDFRLIPIVLVAGVVATFLVVYFNPLRLLAELLQSRMNPDGLAVVMEADHFCMHWRGVKDNATAMINSVMRGSFLKDAALRREFLSLIQTKADILE